jgi:histidinol phosphatase-like PHP family hydrolase
MMNLHNHTTYSNGLFTADKIIEYAINSGLEYIGICDTFGNKNIYDSKTLESYINDIKRYALLYPKIKILVGLEIDTSSEELLQAFDSLESNVLNRLDYMLFENVQDDDKNGMPFFQLINMRRKMSIPIGLAHNDISRNFVDVNQDNLISVLESDRIFIELNESVKFVKFSKPYYIFADTFFRKIRNRDVLISIGTDTYDFLEDVGRVKEAYNFVERMGLQKNLITKLWPLNTVER